MPTENELVFNGIPATVGCSSASGIPRGFDFTYSQWQVERREADVVLYPPSGGAIVLHPNGTWEADAAPFSD